MVETEKHEQTLRNRSGVTETNSAATTRIRRLGRQRHRTTERFPCAAKAAASKFGIDSKPGAELLASISTETRHSSLPTVTWRPLNVLHPLGSLKAATEKPPIQRPVLNQVNSHMFARTKQGPRTVPLSRETQVRHIKGLADPNAPAHARVGQYACVVSQRRKTGEFSNTENAAPGELHSKTRDRASFAGQTTETVPCGLRSPRVESHWGADGHAVLAGAVGAFRDEAQAALGAMYVTQQRFSDSYSPRACQSSSRAVRKKRRY